MQIVCPNCTTSYQIAASTLGEAGRMVRCASCAHQWFEMAADRDAEDAQQHAHAPEMAAAGGGDDWPDPRPAPDARFDVPPAAPPEWSDASAQWLAETAEPGEAGAQHFAHTDTDIAFAPLDEVIAIEDAPTIAPDGDAAFAEGEEAQAVSGDPDAMPDYFEIQRRKKSRVKPKKAAGRGPLITLPRLTAAMVGILIGLLYERVNVVRLMPQTAALYSAVGLKINLRGLTFEDVKTVTEIQDGIPVLVIEGTVRNVTRDSTEVPRLRFAMQNTAGADIYSWTGVAEKPTLAAGESVVFRTKLASPPPESRGAYVRFIQRRDLISASR
jgi:predicted Zn finger-like uncharacterized protein